MQQQYEFKEELLATLDRSTLERYAECPAQARYVETGAFVMPGREAAVGSECHDAISRTIQRYLDASREGMIPRPSDVVTWLETELLETRPDVQPECLRAMRGIRWEIGNLLAGLSPVNILRFDGGDGAKSGQLARDIEGPTGIVRVTSEVDLLHATHRSPEVLDEVDWKTGWKRWDVSDIGDSFQFQMHWWIIADNYPDVQALRVRIFNTRSGRASWGCEFTRRDLTAINSRIHGAIGQWFRWRSIDPEQAGTWPTREKCSICPCVTVCPAPDQDVTHLATDPAAYVGQTLALVEKLKAREKALAAYVDERGEDLVYESLGIAFGRNKPKSERKAKATFYATKGDDATDE